MQARSQPSHNGGGGFFSHFGPLSGFENLSSNGCLGETFIFEVIMIDDVTLCIELTST